VDAVTRAISSGEDLYGLLGLASDATDDDIRRAYRARARQHHPDAHPDETEAGAERFPRIAAAYEVLGDDRARAAYDRALRVQRMSTERTVRSGPVASPVAPRPTGRASARGRAASPNPADHAPRVVSEPPPPRPPVDEWRLLSVLTRVVAAAAAVVVIAVVALMVVSADVHETEPPPPTIWCKTPDGWYDCWQATSPGGS
jgi:hypothetical protein